MKSNALLWMGFFFTCMQVNAQLSMRYNLAELYASKKIDFRPGQERAILEGGKPGAISTRGFAWFKDVTFSEGNIEIDLRGKDVFLNSFLGICFHGADTSKTYDVLYFRPFNFKHADTLRRHWSVGYTSSPGYDYATLRKNFPLKYENTVDPVPDPNDWFHARIEIIGDHLSVFVNGSEHASLELTLINKGRGSKFGLYSDGLSNDFANLVITPTK